MYTAKALHGPSMIADGFSFGYYDCVSSIANISGELKIVIMVISPRNFRYVRCRNVKCYTVHGLDLEGQVRRQTRRMHVAAEHRASEQITTTRTTTAATMTLETTATADRRFRD